MIDSSFAFAGNRLLAAGPLAEVARRAKAFLDAGGMETLLIFDEETGRPVDLDFRGTASEVVARLGPGAPARTEPEARGPGRPKLGVVAREVTLLPRHWEWLQEQPSGASTTLRKLVEEAKRTGQGKDQARKRGEAFHRFATAMAGNLPGFEEVLRAFYARDRNRLEELTREWPGAIRDRARKMAERALDAAPAAPPLPS